MAYGDFKNLPSEKQLLIKTSVVKSLILLIILNVMGIKEFLLPWFLKCLSATHKRRGINSENQQLAYEFHKLKGLKKTKYTKPVNTILGVQT